MTKQTTKQLIGEHRKKHLKSAELATKDIIFACVTCNNLRLGGNGLTKWLNYHKENCSSGFEYILPTDKYYELLKIQIKAKMN